MLVHNYGWPVHRIPRNIDMALGSYQRSRRRIANSLYLDQCLKRGLTEKRFIIQLTEKRI